MKPATKRLAGRWYTSSGARVLLDAPGPHDGHPVADRERLGLIVGHEQRRRAGRPQHVDDVGAQPRPQVRIEAGERFVEQHQPRLGRQRPGQGDALALAAGQLVRVAVTVAGQPDHAEPVVAPRRPGRAGQLAEPERDVVGRREVREQGVLLEHEPGVAVLGLDAPGAVVDDVAADADLAGIGGGEPGGEAQQRRLAAPARPDEGDELVVGDREVDAGDGRGAAVRLADVTDVEDRLAHDAGSARAADRSRCRLSMATGTRATAMIVKAGRAACSNRDSDARS